MRSAGNALSVEVRTADLKPVDQPLQLTYLPTGLGPGTEYYQPVEKGLYRTFADGSLTRSMLMFLSFRGLNVLEEQG